MDNLERMKKAVASPYDYVRGRRGIGYVCSYVPEEIILAAGYTPVRLFGSQGETGLAHRHLQSYCCSLVRGILEEALSGEAADLSAVVFPDACDSIRRLSDIWRINIRGPVHFDFVLPVKLGTKSAEEYTIDILKRFQEELSSYLNVTVSREAIEKSIALMNEIRVTLGQFDRLRADGLIALSAEDYYTVFRAAMIMERHEFLQELKELIGKAKRKEPYSRTKAKVFIVGGMCKVPEIFNAIEEAGGFIVGDDLCIGARYYYGLCPTGLEPIEAIARRILSRPVCPAKHGGINSRLDHIVMRVKETGSEGVIFVTYKFCDPHAFDYPDLRKRLESEGYPTLLLEIEDPLPSEGQVRTRCEAFVEMLRQR
ncbi:MAG: 2-hydroxyacyl-CoA dehydratase family protein [Syntrophales bacterium]|nr:2-hydroxyacyl-CoA dehydratase family protein [Syntrophales bacterium]